MENLEKVMKFIENIDRDLGYLIDYLYQEDDISRVILHLERLGDLHD